MGIPAHHATNFDYAQLTQYFNHVSFRVERMQRNTFLRHHGAKWAEESKQRNTPKYVPVRVEGGWMRKEI